MATPVDAVSNASAKFASIETAIQKVIDQANKLPRDFKDVHDGALEITPHEGVENFGYLEMSEFSARAREIAGAASSLQVAIFQFHRECTDRARGLGLEDGMMTPMSGGGR